jgi:hypothetical protein
MVTGDLAVATEWRNDAKVREPVVVIAFGEEERLGSFHRFTRVRDRDLYQTICKRAADELCPNEVLKDWWKVLAKAEVMRQTSVYRLAAYYLYLASRGRQLPQASREGLHLLGLLPSREFFEHASPAQLLRNYHANRRLIQRIEILSNADRDRLNRAVDSAAGGRRSVFHGTLGRILRYSHSGSEEDRGALWAEEVRDIFEAKKGPTEASHRTVAAELVAAEAILEDDEEEVESLGQQLREAIANFGENEGARVTVELTNRGGQATMHVPQPLVQLLQWCITGDIFGGVFQVTTADTLDRALEDLDHAEFQPFSLTGEKTFGTTLERVVNRNWMERAAQDHWERLVAARRTLAEDAVAIAVSPLVALCSSEKLLSAGHEYLEAYQDLMAVLRDRYEALAQNSPKGARSMCAHLLMLDTILFKTNGGVKAILSPLHPLHLWKFVRLVEQMREERRTLSDEFKKVLAEHAEKLPHFVTAVFVPEGLVSDQALVLPESCQIATLPCYQQDDPHFSGTEGQERLFRVLQKFVALYPHARACLRVCLVDPPGLPELLERLSQEIANGELMVDAAHVVIYRTLDRALNVGGDDDQLEAIAEVFADGEQQRFVLEIHPEKTTYTDVLTQLQQRHVHVFVAFDPSRSQVGQFTGRGGGFIHPLVLPKEFQYDPMEDQLVITPAATGDLFDLFYSMQNRLNNALTGSHFGISTALGPGFPTTGDILKRCAWVVIADKLMDTQPLKGGQVISYEQGMRRDLVVLSDSFTKFEREFGYYLRKVNLDPTEEALRELIVSSADLVAEGLLGLVRPDGG